MEDVPPDNFISDLYWATPPTAFKKHFVAWHLMGAFHPSTFESSSYLSYYKCTAFHLLYIVLMLQTKITENLLALYLVSWGHIPGMYLGTQCVYACCSLGMMMPSLQWPEPSSTTYTGHHILHISTYFSLHTLKALASQWCLQFQANTEPHSFSLHTVTTLHKG